jgi:predicted nucleic acid-binding protein
VIREFFDTSVLVAAFWAKHVHHASSLRLLACANKKHSACGVHSLAEVFATMTALPVHPMIPPEQAVLFLQEMQERLTFVSLDHKEYFSTIRQAADRGFTSGRVYDALLLRCALKSRAAVIYTWNQRHFQSIAPELAECIRTP